MRRSFILICLATLLSLCATAQTSTPPEITLTGLAEKYAPGFPADVNVWVASNDYIDSYCKVGFTIKKDGRVIGNIADYGTVSYRIRLAGNAYSDWTPVTAGSGYITQEVPLDNGNRVVVESFTLGIFEHSCVNRGRPIEIVATFEEIGTYSIDVNVFQVDAVAPYVTQVGSFSCLNDATVHNDMIAMTSSNPRQIATKQIVVDVVPSYAVNFVGLGAGNTVTVDAPAHRDSVMQGDDYVFSISRVACQTGVTVSVDGNTLSANGAGKYTIANVQSDKTVNVQFQSNATYTISNGGDSRISVPASVNCGSDAVVTIRPGANEQVVSVTDNYGGQDHAVSLTNNTYTIPNVQENHTISATYSTYEYPTLSFDNVADRYAPGFPAEVIARINSHGYLDQLCMVEYVVTRNGQTVANLNDYGTVKFSVRLQGNTEVERELTAGTGVVNEEVEYNGHIYQLNAFTASIFDNSTCLNRQRPITFTASFTEIGNYEVTVNLYKAIVDNEIQVTDMGTTYTNACNGNAVGHDRIAMNARKGDLIATLSQSVNVVPSYVINFVGLGADNSIDVYAPARDEYVMQGDDYVFSIGLMECQNSVASVTVDGNVLTANNGKYTIANVRSNKTVNVEFVSDTYTISTSDPQIIVPSQPVNYGENAVVTIRPADNYVVATVTDNFNGENKDVTRYVENNTYTIENVTEDHFISATYTRLETPTISFEDIDDKYAPGFPADAVARINSHGDYDRLCMVEYEISRNGEQIANINDFGSVQFSVRLAGNVNVTRELTQGTAIVGDTITYEGVLYDINAFSASIFDNSSCLNRTRPINFHATFTQVGTYTVTVRLYEASVDSEYISEINTYEDCNHVTHSDKIALNARRGSLITSLSQTINVVPSYKITFNGLAEGNSLNVDLPAKNDSVMQGDDYVFGISLMDCQSAITSVTVDGATLTPDANGKYTIANVQSNKTVTVTFASQMYVVAAQVNDDNAGSVTEGGSFECGEDAVITITPNANYEIASVTDNGSPVVVNGNTYIINNITTNHQIMVNFTELSRPTISIEDVADKYAPGFPADVIARVNSHAVSGSTAVLDQLCKVEYTIKRNGNVINNISEFGTVSYTVRLSGANNITRDLVSGHGFISETVEYEGTDYNIDAFTVSIFDNSDCLNHQRPISFHATFNEVGTYEVNVKLWSANPNADPLYLSTIHQVTDCDGNVHDEKIGINAEAVAVLDELTQTINVVPSYAISFNGLADGNTVELVGDNNRVKLDSIMEGEDYKFRINLVDCQDEVSRVTVDGNVILPEGGVYTVADVRSDITINVAFLAHSYVITANAGENGTVEVDASIVTCGENAVVTITPAANYSIETVMDGTTDVTASVVNGVYTIENVTADHTVTATFVANAIPTIIFEPLASEKYAPNFPVEAVARINSNGYYDRMCKVEYIIKRNGRVVNNISDFGSVSYSVRLAGNNPISRELTNGSGFVAETIEYDPEDGSGMQTYSIDAFSVGIFDNYACLNRNRPFNILASFTEIGYYEVTVNLYDAICDPQYITNINAYEDCNHVAHNDMIALNATAGQLIATETVSVEVVPSFKITFVGLEDGNEVVADAPAHADSVMYGDPYVFAINGLVGCQTGIASVEVDGNALTAENGKYTIADVRENKTVNVTFALESFAITATTDGNGTATVDNANVTCGDTAIITFTANDGFELASVTDNNQPVAFENNTYKINGVTEAHEIVATFTAIILPEIVVDESTIAEKYAPGFPADVVARINTHGNYDRICKVGYTITRNDEAIERIADYGTVSYSVRLQGETPITRDLINGSGFVSEIVNYNNQPYSIDAFSAGIFDNSDCLNRNRPITFHATFTQPGTYKIVTTIYEANYTDGQVSAINTYADCNGVQHVDMIGYNTSAGAVLAQKEVAVLVVPSYVITFEGLEGIAEHTSYEPANGDTIMEGDNYIFSLEVAQATTACQASIDKVTVDGAELTADAEGKYTIANVDANKVVNVTFTYPTFAITASANNGTATVDNAEVTCGENATVTFAANDGFELVSVTDNDVDVTTQIVNNTYTLVNVVEAHNVVATFTAIVLPEIVVDESTIAEKYAPGFPADITAHINTNGNYDRICKIGYAITRNGETVERVSDFGTASYSVRLAGNEPISRDIVTGSGFVSEVVNYNDQPYSIDAFSAGIFDSSDCLNRHRPLNFHATFNEVGDYKVVITMYEANYTDGQVSSINTYADCNGVQHDDMIGYNTSAGAILATKEISVHVVPSYVVTFEGLEGIAEHTSYEPANGDTIMEGDSYIFSLEVAQATTACQASIDKVTVDGAELTADAEGKYTIANVDANKVVNVTFTYPTFAITASATNGTATVDNAEVTCGENATVTFAANDGFELASVTDNDADVTAQVVNNTYTLVNVVEAHNIVATFNEIVYPTIAFDSIAPKYAPGFPADVIGRINSEGNPDRMVKVGYEVTRNGQPVDRISDYGTLSYSVRLAGTNTITRDIENGNGFISERVDYEGATYYIDAFTVGIFDNNTCVNRNRPVELHAAFDSIGEYSVTIKLYDVDTTHALVDVIGSFTDCNGVSHNDKIAISARATNEIASLTQIVNVVPSYVVTFEGLAEGNTHTSYAPAINDSIMQGDNFIFSLEGTAACQTGIASVATADGATLTADAEGKYTIENVQSDMTVVVTYNYETFAINVTTDGNGEAVATPNPVTCGENAEVTITPNASYVIASVTLDGDDVTASVVDGTFTIENVTAEHNVTVNFRNNALPTITVDEFAERYAPGYPADIVGHVNSNENFDRMCKFEYTIKRNGEPISNIADYGSMSYKVRLAGNNEISRDITAGSGFISETVEYEGENYEIDAFTVGIFDNNPCANRNRPVTFHAEFDSIGTYEVTVKLYDADTTNAMVSNVTSFTDCHGVRHNDKIAINAVALDSVATATFTINVVPSYIITFEGLAEGNTYASLDTVHGDTVMQGNNYSFTLDGLAECQTGIASVATDVAVLEAVEGVYTIENVQSDMTVNVTYNYASFVINVETDGNGTAVARPDTVMCGDSVAVYITPNEYYEIASVTLDGDDVTANVTDGVYVINNVTAAHDVYVTFNEVERPYYHVTFEGLEEGNTVVSETADTVRHGDNYVFGIELTECQSAIDTVYVGGLAVVPNEAGSYTIENVVSDTTVLVTFVHRYFTIATVADNNGTVVAMPESVYCGDSAVVYITPNDNYEIESVVLDSVDVTANLVVDSTSTYYVINNVTTDHTVTVTFSQIPYYTVTFVGLEDENEVVSATGDTVRRGDNYVFAINGLAQCQAAIDTVYVGGQILTADDNGNYTIENVVSDTTVTVTFRVATYAINVTADNNGTVVVTPETITCGDSAVIVITPNENYEIESVMLDSLDITAEFADSTYTLMNIVADHALNVTFVNIPSYVITFEGLVEGNTHVVYEPANGDTVMRGENYIFGLEGLADCQEAIDSVSVNGQALVADDEGHYTIENVQSDLTVNVAYVTSTYTIAMFAGEHGSVAADTVTVDCGSDYEVVFTPAAGYQIGTVTMDTLDVTENVSGNSLMLTNIHADHSVSATFVIIPPESPYVEFVGLENSYASGDTIDFELKLHANRVLDNLCAVGYELRYYNTDTTSTVVADATRYGVFNYSVNITDTTVASNIIRTGSGLLNATAQYGNNTYDVSAFTLGLFDSECAGRDRDIDFDAVFSVAGRYQFNVSLYTCANGGTAIGTRYEACDGMIHYDRVDAVCDSMTVINTATQEIEISGETLYTITASVIGSNGTVEPNGTVVVNAGSTYDVVFIPDENYAIDTVKDNGFIRYPVEGSGYVFNNVYTLTNISENHNITVTYRDIRAYYNIHVEVESAGGDVTPRDTTVVDGADVTLIVTPNSGYHISQLEIDGNLVTNCETNEIIFHNVQADHIVKIAFFPNSIDEEAFSDLSVYPNPNNGKFTVSSTEFEGEVTLQLFNASGAAIDERTLTDQEYVDYDRELPTGTYILRIISGDKVATRKIVVE